MACWLKHWTMKLGFSLTSSRVVFLFSGALNPTSKIETVFLHWYKNFSLRKFKNWLGSYLRENPAFWLHTESCDSVTDAQGWWQWYGQYDHGRTSFWGRKNGVALILIDVCVIEWPLRAVCHSLGCLRGLPRTFSSLQASKVVARELRHCNFLDTWAWGKCANWGGANMRIVR